MPAWRDKDVMSRCYEWEVILRHHFCTRPQAARLSGILKSAGKSSLPSTFRSAIMLVLNSVLLDAFLRRHKGRTDGDAVLVARLKIRIRRSRFAVNNHTQSRQYATSACSARKVKAKSGGGSLRDLCHGPDARSLCVSGCCCSFDETSVRGFSPFSRHLHCYNFCLSTYSTLTQTSLWSLLSGDDKVMTEEF